MAQEKLVFVITSIADGAEQGFKKAEEAARGLGESYEELMQQEKEAQSAQEAYTKAIKKSVGSFVAFAAASRKVSIALNTSVQSYNNARNALAGLQSIAEGTGNSMDALQKELQSLTKNGILPVGDATTALKNLLQRGYTVDQAVKTIERLTDAAAFGRQEGLKLGEAVRIATEGLRQENSVLVDNAGVTKNVAKMWQEYANARGIAYQDLTMQQKIEAEYIGIMEETRFQIGDAEKLTKEYAGTQAKLAAETERVRVALGEAATQGAAPFMAILGNTTSIVADLLEQNKGVTAGLVGFMRAALAAGAAVTGFRVAMVALGKDTAATTGIIATAGNAIRGFIASIGPVGVAFVAISALGAALFSGASASAKEAQAEFQALKEEVENSTEGIEYAHKKIDKFEALTAKGTSRTAQETEELKMISAELVDTYGDRVGYLDDEGNAIITNLDYARERLEVEKQITAEKLKTIEAEQERKKESLSMSPDAEAAKNAVNDIYQQYIEQLKAIEDMKEQLRASLEYLADTGVDTTATKEAYQQRIDAYVEEGEYLLERYEAANREFEEKYGAELQQHQESLAEIDREIIDTQIQQAELELGRIPPALKTVIQEVLEDLSPEDGYEADDVISEFISHYFKIEEGLADEIIETTIPQIQLVRDQLMAELATFAQDTGDASYIINGIFGEVASPENIQMMMDEGKALAEALAQGSATPTQAEAFDATNRQMISIINSLMQKVAEAGESLEIPVDKPMKALADFSKQFQKTSDEVLKAAAETKAAEETFQSMAGSVEMARDDVKAFTKALEDIAVMQEAIDIIREGEEASDDYADALQWLAEETGLTEEAVLNSLDSLQEDVDMKMLLLEANLLAAEAEAVFKQGVVNAMLEAGQVTQEQADVMIQALDNVIAKLQEIDGVRIDLEEDNKGGSIKVRYPWRSSGGGGGGVGSRGAGRRRSSGGGGGSRGAGQTRYENEALDNALEEYERLKRLNELTLQDEIEMLEQIKAKHAKTNDELIKLDDKLYEVRKSKREADYQHALAMDELTLQDQVNIIEQEQMNYKYGTEAWRDLERQKYELKKSMRLADYQDALAMDRLTLQDQITYLEQEQEHYRQGTEAWRELEHQKYELQKQLRQQEYDLAVYYNELTLEDQLRMIEEMTEHYKEGTQARIELEKQAYDLRIQMAQQYYDMQLFLGQMSYVQQIQYLQQMLDQETYGSQRYIDLYKQLHTTQTNYRRTAYETAVFYGKLTLEQQAEFLAQEMQMYREGSQQRIEIERQLYSTLQQIRSQKVQQIQAEYSEQKQALQSWYQGAVQSTNRYYDNRIKRAREAARARTKSLQNQIRSLKRAKREEDRMEEASKRRRNIEALKQRIQYEHDEYNKRKLMEQLGREEDDFRKWQRDNEVQDKVESLNLQIQAVQESLQKEIEMLTSARQASLAMLQEEYEKKLKLLEKEMEEKKAAQDEWLEKLAGYLSSYEKIGQLLGEGFRTYFEAEIDQAHDSVMNLFKDLQSLNAEIAYTAGRAAEAVLGKTIANRQTADADLEKKLKQETMWGLGVRSAQPPSDVTINFNQPIGSPVQTSREIKRAIEQATRMR